MEKWKLIKPWIFKKVAAKTEKIGQFLCRNTSGIVSLGVSCSNCVKGEESFPHGDGVKCMFLFKKINEN